MAIPPNRPLPSAPGPAPDSSLAKKEPQKEDPEVKSVKALGAKLVGRIPMGAPSGKPLPSVKKDEPLKLPIETEPAPKDTAPALPPRRTRTKMPTPLPKTQEEIDREFALELQNMQKAQKMWKFAPDELAVLDSPFVLPMMGIVYQQQMLNAIEAMQQGNPEMMVSTKENARQFLESCVNKSDGRVSEIIQYWKAAGEQLGNKLEKLLEKIAKNLEQTKTD